MTGKRLVVPACSLLFVLLCGLCPWQNLLAQGLRYGERPAGPAQSVLVGYAPVTFKYRGSQNLVQRFDFRDPVYSVTYTRPGISLSGAYGVGSDSANSNLLDLALLSYGDLYNSARSGAKRRSEFYVPVGLYTQYHRTHRANSVEGSELSNDFSVTVLGLGVGGGFRSDLARNIRFDVRALPILGLTSVSFGDGTGYSRVLDTSAQLAFDRLFGRAGLTLGYAFRTQIWDVGGLSIMGSAKDLYDYGEARHLFRAGISW